MHGRMSHAQLRGWMLAFAQYHQQQEGTLATAPVAKQRQATQAISCSAV